MLDKIIPYSFYLLFFLTPLFWTSKNYELFEYNKMILTFGITVLIVGAWILKMIQEKTFIIKRTPLDIPLLLFLGANVLSTIFSIDLHTSVWGYYSRSNGGLLSITSYLLLYFAFVSNMDKERVLTTLKFGLGSGFLISLWAIMEHFGVSLSCVILRGEFNDGCWIQDVQARVFASLGQPNWLAAYLSMLIFPALYFFLSATTRRLHTIYYTLLLTYYLAFTFTYSRGPTLGLVSGMVVFLGLSFWKERQRMMRKPPAVAVESLRSYRPSASRMIVIIISFLLINLLFGSSLTSFRLVSKFAAPVRPAISLPNTPQSGTQLENGGTESGQIRFIVWQGAFDIFKHYPIFGSGVETFAYSYYQFRPQAHNLTSEWDFLYNKAHNEYLNYLATTGIVGFGAYMLVIGTFLMWSIKYVVIARNEVTKQSISLTGSPRSLSLARDDGLLIFALIASYISYLIYNFFLFSVVIIAVFFYLFPALVFVITDSTSIFQFIYRRLAYTQIAKAIVVIFTLYLLYSVFKLWYADTIFSSGQKASELGNPGRAYNMISLASDLNSGEPFYRSELAYSAAAASAALATEDATLSAALKDEALLQLDQTLHQSPKNTSFWRKAVTTYFELSSLDKKYTDQTLKALDYTVKLAPTDPKLYYNKALILDSLDKKDEEIKVLQQALKLKPNYLEALEQLKEATASTKP